MKPKNHDYDNWLKDLRADDVKVSKKYKKKLERILQSRMKD